MDQHRRLSIENAAGQRSAHNVASLAYVDPFFGFALDYPWERVAVADRRLQTTGWFAFERSQG
jgi:hypothetical protein